MSSELDSMKLERLKPFPPVVSEKLRRMESLRVKLVQRQSLLRECIAEATTRLRELRPDQANTREAELVKIGEAYSELEKIPWAIRRIRADREEIMKNPDAPGLFEDPDEVRLESFLDRRTPKPEPKAKTSRRSKAAAPASDTPAEPSAPKPKGKASKRPPEEKGTPVRKVRPGRGTGHASPVTESPPPSIVNPGHSLSYAIPGATVSARTVLVRAGLFEIGKLVAFLQLGNKLASLKEIDADDEGEILAAVVPYMAGWCTQCGRTSEPIMVPAPAICAACIASKLGEPEKDATP